MIIKDINQIQSLFPKKFIKRDLIGKLESDLDKKEIQIIYGPRQAGKSTIMYKIMENLFSAKTNIFYFNLDEPDEAFSSAETFMEDILSRITHEGTAYIFIDEIQRKKDIGLFLKYIYDRNINFKFIVTGSSSLSIKNIISEPLTGRKFEYFLAPLSVFEIIADKGINSRILKKSTPEILQIIDDFLLFGGYPQVVLCKNTGDKIRKLAEISKSYITRDLKDTYDIKNTIAIESTAVYLSQNIGNILSKQNISKTLSLTTHQVNQILEALEKSFIISFLKPFFHNPVKEVSHRPKVYFLDNGIRNILIQKIQPNLIISDRGKLFEQTVWQILDNTNHDYIKYWRNINQTEVDFIIEKGGKIEAYEAKYSFETLRLPKNLSSFVNMYKGSLTKYQVITRDNLICFTH